MKPSKNLLLVLILSFITLYGCQQNSEEITDAERVEIERTIRNLMDDLTEAVNEHDAVEIMAFCWNSKDYYYVGNGKVFKGFQDNFNSAVALHSDPKYKSFTVDYSEIIVKVINKDVAKVIGIGSFNNFPTDEGTTSVDLAITFLFERIEGKWLLTFGHESTYEQIF